MTQCPSEKRFVGTVSSAPEGWGGFGLRHSHSHFVLYMGVS